ncbi:transcription factor ILI7-like [Punica granatum]|uniref:Uncharacterized protein n=2 Tax=Punica granatum TaxID=22663 RepID=A0A218XZP7_PUNGR|nr:transcription factor ILI7-like [Punica granatum]OWM90424.1 hypothetical protein CDL15_Pgr014727 [Punica granatum]PKI78001.1 hypothetical protein CRG98_001621 [Punica granatum]
MSGTSRRSAGSPAPSTATLSEDEIRDFVSKLQELIPQLNHRSNGRVPTEVLKETCSYIQRLNREVEELSEKLSKLLDNMGISSADVELIKTLLDLY